MSRTRLAALALLASAALAGAGIAAASQRRSQSTQAATATFTATSLSHASSKTCTAGDGSYRETTATYSGSATSPDARLNGPLAIRAHSIVDTTSGLGWVEGSYRVHGAAHGTFHAAVSGGNAVGALTGDAGKPAGKLVASLAAAFTPDGGFSSGSLGAGSANGAGVVFQRGRCERAAAARTVAVATLRFTAGKTQPASGRATGAGSLTLDLTRDANGAIGEAKVVFYVNYRFGGAVTITQLALHQGVKGAGGPVVVDAGAGTTTDTDGNGNLTRVVTGVSGAVAQALLANPHAYYVELTSNGPTLRAQLGGFRRR